MSLNKITASLHNHSTFSDGADSPQEVIDRAFDSGITHFTISDHDTHQMLSPRHMSEIINRWRGLNRETYGLDVALGRDTETGSIKTEPLVNPNAVDAPDTGMYVLKKGEVQSLLLYRGVEYTVMFEGKSRHLIGLGVRYPHDSEVDRCKDIQTARIGRIHLLAEEINGLVDDDYKHISIEGAKLVALIRNSVPSRLHLGALIADQLRNKGGIDLTARQAMDRYVPKSLRRAAISGGVIPEMKDIVTTIHQLGGVAILPHIHRNGLGDHDDYERALRRMILQTGLDGFEVQDGRYNQCDISDEYLRIADSLNRRLHPEIFGLPAGKSTVVISWGADFHGRYNSEGIIITGSAPPVSHPDALQKLEERMLYWRENNPAPNQE